MTFQEKLVLACEIGNEFMPMGTFCIIDFKVFPHSESDGFKAGEKCWEMRVSCLSPEECHFGLVGKTPEEALDKSFAALRTKADREVSKRESAAEGADYWRELFESIPQIAIDDTD